MAIPMRCPCGYQTEVRDEYAGKRVRCPACGRPVEVDVVWAVPPETPAAPAAVVPEALRAREYKVLTRKDQWFSRRFDPEAVEAAINGLSAQGWRVVGVTAAHFPGFLGGDRDELVIILER